MKKITILCVGMLLHVFLLAQTPNKMTTVREHPMPGDTVKIIYNSTSTPLQNAAAVTAVIYAYNNYQWQVSELPLKRLNKSWQGVFKSSPQCGFFAVKFMAGDSVDNNNEQAYGVMFADRERKKPFAPGAYAGWGLLRSPKYGYGIPNYFKSFSITDTATYFWMNQEISFHPNEASVALSIPFAQSLLRSSGKNAITRLSNVIAYLEKQGTEDASWRAHKVQVLVGPKEKADSLGDAIVQQFPKGNLAKLKAYQAIQFEKDAAKRLELSKAFLLQFPEVSANKEFDEANLIKYSTLYHNMVLMSGKEGYAVMKQYINQLPYAAVVSLYYRLIDVMHKRKDIPDAELYPYSVMLINRMEQFKSAIPNEYWYLTPKEMAKQVENDMAPFMLITHVNIAKNSGHVDEALRYAEWAEKILRYKRAELNHDYATLLNTKKHYAVLHKVLEKSMYENQASEEMIALLKEDYTRRNKSLKGFNEYKERLKNPALIATEKEQTISQMMNVAMLDWTMTDFNGNKVSMQNLKGKIVVMDFWATWCVPCKTAFPGMKLAVEKYKNDSNVVFLFVDTEEFKPDYQKDVANYIKEKNYPFNVLFDNKLPGQKQNDEVFKRICAAYKTSGIPLKMVIDGKGILRFLIVGYKGSPIGLADEIANMVETVKKQELINSK